MGYLRQSCCRVLALLLTAIAALPAIHARQGRAEGFDIPPEHHAWGSFRPGSWTRLKTTEFARDGEGQEHVLSISVTTTRLEAAHDDGVTLAVEQSLDGQPGTSETRRLGWDDEPIDLARRLRLSVGEIKLASRTYVCQTHEISTGDAGAETVAKHWYTADLWPHVLKRTVRTGGALRRFVSFEIVEPEVTEEVLGQERRCARCRTVETSDAEASESIELFCPDVPGGLAHAETERRDKRTGAIVYVRAELEAFEAAE
jgi:hypothetical protein